MELFDLKYKHELDVKEFEDRINNLVAEKSSIQAQMDEQRREIEFLKGKVAKAITHDEVEAMIDKRLGDRDAASKLKHDRSEVEELDDNAQASKHIKDTSVPSDAQASKQVQDASVPNEALKFKIAAMIHPGTIVNPGKFSVEAAEDLSAEIESWSRAPGGGNPTRIMNILQNKTNTDNSTFCLHRRFNNRYKGNVWTVDHPRCFACLQCTKKGQVCCVWDANLGKVVLLPIHPDLREGNPSKMAKKYWLAGKTKIGRTGWARNLFGATTSNSSNEDGNDGESSEE